MQGTWLGAAVVAVVVVACSSSATPKPAAPTPPHAITVILSLTGADPWEPEPPGCHGTGSLDDLLVGTPVQVMNHGKKLATGAFTASKIWLDSAGRAQTCTLTATIEAVPTALEYTFTFGSRTSGSTVPYASVVKNLWFVQVRL